MPRCIAPRTGAPEERARIAAGEDVFVSLVSFGHAPMTPLMVHCGPADWMAVPDAAG
jgi:hypothetical protein